jgi:hypothetical protein
MEDPYGAIGEAWPPDGPAADALFKCAWYDRYTVAQTLVGFGRGTPPWSWPGSPNLKCLSLGRIVGSGRPRVLQVPRGVAPNIIPAGWPEYDYAIIPANFGILPYATGDGTPENPIQDPSGKPWTTTRFRVAGEVFQPPGGTYYYQGEGDFSGKPVEKSTLGIIRPKTEISITRHRVTGLDIGAIEAYMGTLNIGNVTFGNKTYDPGWLMFAGWNSNVSINSLGQVETEAEYSVMSQDGDWNEIQAKDGNWYLINTMPDGTGDNPFAYTDFSMMP